MAWADYGPGQFLWRRHQAPEKLQLEHFGAWGFPTPGKQEGCNTRVPEVTSIRQAND